MPRQRERFERTDVPRNNPARPYIAIAVIIVVAIATFIMTTSFWRKANQLNGLNDGELNSALYEQGYTNDPTEGVERSDDDFSNVAVFIVDDIHAEAPQLRSAQILVRNMDNPRATIASLPLNTKLFVSDSRAVLQQLFGEAGAVGALAPFTEAANIHVSHVIVGTERLWEQLENLKDPLIVTLLSSATNELETINTDYHTSELLELAAWLRDLGFENIARIDAPFNEETFEDGTPVANIDSQRLCIDVGTFIEVAPPPPPVEEEPVEEEYWEEEYYEEW